MTEFIFKKLAAGFDAPEYRWSAMLNPPEKPAKKIAPKARPTEKRAKITKA